MARKVIVELVGDASSLERTLRGAQSSTTSFGSKMGTALKAGGLLAAAGIGAAIVATKGFIDAAADAERVQAKLEVAMKNAGISYQDNAKAIDAVITKSSELSGFDDEDLSESLANMIRTTHDLNKAYELNALAADIARTKGMDLAAAQSLLARVYNGSFMGVKRLGVALTPVTAAQDALKESTKKATDEQTRHAKELDKVATREEAIATLQKNFAGQAEAYGNTAAGAQDRFRVAMENVQETLGNLLLPKFTEWVNKLAAAAGFADRYIKALHIILAGHEDAGTSAVTAGNSVAHMGQQMDSATRAAYESQDAIKTSQSIWQKFTGILMLNWKALYAAAGAMLYVNDKFKSADSVIASAATAFWNFGTKVAGGMAHASQVVQDKFADIQNILIRVANDAFISAYNIGRSMVSGVIAGLKDLGVKVKDAITSGFMWGVHAAGKALSGSGEFWITKHLIGKPAADATIAGWVEGIAPLPAKMAESMRTAIEAARQQIAASRSVLEAAFGELSGLASNLFGMTRKQTPAEIALAKMQAADQKAALLKAQSDANDALLAGQEAYAQAAAGGVSLSPEDQQKLASGGITQADADKILAEMAAKREAAMLAASQSVVQAQIDQKAAAHAIEEADLAAQAAKERKQKDAKDAVEAANFAKDLEKLGARLKAKGATAAAATEAIIKLLAKYGVNFGAVGRDAGIAYIQALKDAIMEAAGSAGALSGTIGAAAAGIAVPAPKFPSQRAGGGPVSGGSIYLVGERGPEFFVPGRSGTIVPNASMRAGGDTYNLSFPNYAGSQRDLEDTIVTALARIKGRNGVIPGMVTT